ncbi:hypothetical protein BDV3_005007 [Batrachochytrium dendrobatidis]|uniref:Partial AB-hydrolase lipase domain-containing protein n=1 Tax=Batrachochytrium dendrobatidis (strain JEL423) TaxID=403673 RepID=A0A177WK78_BATDL|nr:cholesterol esterase [Batrachochytrium dendrobatidis]OAJ40527.1 hypothetical protein BDEG_24247 [Batrachochytrium dendrobatidis JEL423]
MGRMFYIPVLGRMSIVDYLRLFFAFSILVIEHILRFIFSVLPLHWLAEYIRCKLTRHAAEDVLIDRPETDIHAERQFMTLDTTEALVTHWKLPFQSHYVTTKDGYILNLHRIPGSRANNIPRSAQMSGDRPLSESKSANGTAANSTTATSWSTTDASQPEERGLANVSHFPTKPVVLLWHGFLMCSEVWVCSPDPTSSLAITLAEAGYDVWLGNTRGNKYSCKHTSFKPNGERFWDFSMDQLALCDLPDSIEYILQVTGVSSLTYIGFSQGTAQGFAALSLSTKLNSQINLFIALAPATKPHGLENKTIDSLVHVSPEFIYLLFGHRVLLSSALLWQSILSPETFSSIIDMACRFLFGWKANYMDAKHIVYRHLYSYSSVKIVVHWFQIMKTGRFQMYDDLPPMMPNGVEGYHIPRFPTSQIQTPIAIIYGGKDTLPDMDYILKNTPMPSYILKIEEYEHLQFLWGSGISKVIFPAILGLLHNHTQAFTDTQSFAGHSSSEFQSTSESLLDTGGELEGFHYKSNCKRHDCNSVKDADIRSVPWISRQEIHQLLQLGEEDHLSTDSTQVVGRGSSISVQQVLDSVSQHKQLFPLELANFVDIKSNGPAVYLDGLSTPQFPA